MAGTHSDDQNEVALGNFQENFFKIEVSNYLENFIENLSKLGKVSVCDDEPSSVC